jgi:hypothetical protein
MAATPNTWFVMIPPSYVSDSTSEKEKVDFVIQYPAGSQAWKDAYAGKIIQGTEGNTGNPQVSEQLIKWLGPYATQAEAKTAANPQQQSPNPVNDATNAVENSNQGKAVFSGVNAIGNFFNTLGEASTWRRVAKVVIGGTLLIFALAHATGADNAVANTAKRLPLPV